MGRSGRKSEHRPERQPVAGSEEHPVGDGTRESAQRAVFATQQIVCQV